MQSGTTSLLTLRAFWPDLRNKVVHTLFLVFMQTYTSSWSDFFDAFISLLPNNATASTSEDPYNPKTTDLFLRLLHEISTEISDTTLRLNKAHARLTRDTELRDAVRAKDARSIVEQTSRILQYALSRTETPSTNLSSKQAAEIAEMAMRVLADHACELRAHLRQSLEMTLTQLLD